jgi:hypothetical protein
MPILCEVVEVNWSEDKVMTKCSDGTQLISDHVIVTIPLGVLKETHHTLFQPPLPQEKVKAIQVTFHLFSYNLHSLILPDYLYLDIYNQAINATSKYV